MSFFCAASSVALLLANEPFKNRRELLVMQTSLFLNDVSSANQCVDGDCLVVYGFQNLCMLFKAKRPSLIT